MNVRVGGQAAIRGYLLQTLVAVLDALLRSDWLSVQMEPSKSSEKVDIVWEYPGNRTKVVQVKSSDRPFGRPLIRTIARELKDDAADATEHEVVLCGTFKEGIGDRIEGVRIQQQPHNLETHFSAAAQLLDQLCVNHNWPRVEADDRLQLVNALAMRFEVYSTLGKRISREELEELLSKWIDSWHAKELGSRVFYRFPIPESGVSSSFVGRQRELQRLTTLLKRAAAIPTGSQTKPIIVSGMAGIGKSTLVTYAAEYSSVSESDDRPEGVRYLFSGGAFTHRFDPSTDLAAVQDQAVEFLRGGVRFDADPASYLKQKGREVLIIVDNADDVDEHTIARLCDLFAENVLVITTRKVFAADMGNVINVSPLSSDESVDLFRQIISANDKDFTKADESHIKLICHECAGLPLALTIVANLAATSPHTLSWIRRQLKGGLKSAELDQLRRCFDLSFTGLSTQQRRLFVFCSEFEGADFSTELAVRFASPLIASKRVLDREIRTLVSRSLLQVASPGRCHMHPLLKQYGRRKTALKRKEVIQAIASGYLRQIRTAKLLELQQTGQAKQEVPGLVEFVTSSLVEFGQWKTIVEITKKVDSWLYRHGLWTDRQRVLAAALEACKRHRQEALADFRYLLAESYEFQNKYSRALAELSRCERELQSTRRRDKSSVIARVRRKQGWLHQSQSNFQTACQFLNKCLKGLQSPKEPIDLLTAARCHTNLAAIHFELGDSSEAWRNVKQAEARLALLKDTELDTKTRIEKADVLHQIGNVYFYGRWTDIADARKLYDKALTTLDHRPNTDVDAAILCGFIYDHLGQLYFRSRNIDQSESTLAEAKRHFDSVGQRDGLAYVADHLGEIELARGFACFCEGQRQNGSRQKACFESAAGYLKIAAVRFGKAYSVFCDLEKKDAQAWLLHHLGEAEQELANVELARGNVAAFETLLTNAMTHFGKAETLFNELKYTREALHIQLHLTDIEYARYARTATEDNRTAFDSFRTAYVEIIKGLFRKDEYKDLYGNLYREKACREPISLSGASA